MSDWLESCRTRLPKHLDANGDLAPPGEKFPTYEHLCLGGRMGAGEDWIGLWGAFLDAMATDFETRSAYLERHRPAPECWARSVASVLWPGESDEATASRMEELWASGRIGVDAAFETWRQQRPGPRLPWQLAESPEDAARYHTRELWFVSRLRGTLTPEELAADVPAAWSECEEAFRSGQPGYVNRKRGLLSLAQTLASGTLLAPWEIGASPSEFTDSFENDMGYVDAFRLWAMSAFDGERELALYLEAHPASEEWLTWVRAEVL